MIKQTNDLTYSYPVLVVGREGPLSGQTGTALAGPPALAEGPTKDGEEGEEEDGGTGQHGDEGICAQVYG